MTPPHPKNSGKIVILCFIAFFGVIIAVNSVFLYMAMKSNTGVIAENAYEKGLAYNQILETARQQPSLQDKMTYENGTLKWQVADEGGAPLKGGQASVTLVRPVKSGYDFALPLKETSPGLYIVNPEFPMHGLWTARLDIKWNNKQYQTSQDLIAQ